MASSSQQKQVDLFIDCDPGIDDTLALLLALHTPHCNVVGISTTHGNAPLKAVTQNLEVIFDILEIHQAHLKNRNVDGKRSNNKDNDDDDVDVRIPYEMYSKQKIVVAVGADKPLKGLNQFALDVHGSNGLGKLTQEGIDAIKRKFSLQMAASTGSSVNPLYVKSERDAADELIHQLEVRPAKSMSLVCLGPLTNLAIALQRKPDVIKSRLKGVYIMGGCVQQPYPGGNITPCAEFNFYCDAYAADLVMSEATSAKPFECPVVVVPLDATEYCRLTYTVFQNHIVPLAEHAALPSFCAGFMEYIFGIVYDKHSIVEDSTSDELSQSALAMHDPMAVAIALDSIFNAELIMTDGHGVGDTIVKKMKSVDWARVECSELSQKEGDGDAKSLTKGMFLTDGRRWRRRTSNGKDKKQLAQKVLNAHKAKQDYPQKSGIQPEPGKVSIIMEVDSSKFFNSFLWNVFGIVWDEQKHAWVNQPES
ncbi:hypothetical protein MP228_010078 [Amoeboaphelidium protococcarum]|nr:hypothetical protein MP228_010078 [Amoeboaphelidium protococcarum]